MPVPSQEQVPFYAHPTAIIEDGALLGSATKVWHHTHVRAGAVIGDRCVLGKNVFVDKGVRVGNQVKVQNNVSLYVGVELENEVFVGPSVVFTNDRWPRSTAIEWEISKTLVRRGASIGANVTVVAGNTIGEWAFVAAGSVLTRSVLSHEIVAGNPARCRGWVCRCTRVRVGVEAASLMCDSCGTKVERLRDLSPDTGAEG